MLSQQTHDQLCAKIYGLRGDTSVLFDLCSRAAMNMVESQRTPISQGFLCRAKKRLIQAEDTIACVRSEHQSLATTFFVQMGQEIRSLLSVMSKPLDDTTRALLSDVKVTFGVIEYASRIFVTHVKHACPEEVASEFPRVGDPSGCCIEALTCATKFWERSLGDGKGVEQLHRFLNEFAN